MVTKQGTPDATEENQTNTVLPLILFIPPVFVEPCGLDIWNGHRRQALVLVHPNAAMLHAPIEADC